MVKGEWDEGDLVLVEGVHNIVGSGVIVVASVEFAVNDAKAVPGSIEYLYHLPSANFHQFIQDPVNQGIPPT